MVRLFNRKKGNTSHSHIDTEENELTSSLLNDDNTNDNSKTPRKTYRESAEIMGRKNSSENLIRDVIACRKQPFFTNLQSLHADNAEAMSSVETICYALTVPDLKTITYEQLDTALKHLSEPLDKELMINLKIMLQALLFTKLDKELQEGKTSDHSERDSEFKTLITMLKERKNSKYMNLAGINLTGADLANVNLTAINLEGANLSKTNLSHANLSVSNLERVNLENANLSHANLEKTSLAFSTLRGASVFRTNLKECTFENTDLANLNTPALAIFSKCEFPSATWLTEKDLEGKDNLLSALEHIQRFVQESKSLSLTQKTQIAESVVQQISSALTRENVDQFTSEAVCQRSLFKSPTYMGLYSNSTTILEPLQKAAKEVKSKQQPVL